MSSTDREYRSLRALLHLSTVMDWIVVLVPRTIWYGAIVATIVKVWWPR